MKKLVSILTFLTLILSGCSNEPEGICVDPPPEDMRLASSSAWPEECRSIKLYCNFRGLKGLTQVQFRSLAQQACRNCSSASGLNVTLTDVEEEANIHLEGLQLAARGGPLAWCQYPGDCDKVFQCRFNTNTTWTAPLFLDTLVHELGHGFGMTHTAQTRDIMYPVMKTDRNIKGTYGPLYSGPEMVKRYGPHSP